MHRPPASVLTRRRFIGAATRSMAGMSVLGLAGCNGAAGSRVTGKLKIPLASSFIGNTWRLEMENTYRAALAMDPYRTQVFGQVFNSENDMSDQAQQLSNLISAGVDAILIDSASPTGLNGVVSQAIERGILVISFDNIVTAPGGHRGRGDRPDDAGERAARKDRARLRPRHRLRRGDPCDPPAVRTQRGEA
jgi:ABC-type sugar transport system substrate-binding protein